MKAKYRYYITIDCGLAKDLDEYQKLLRRLNKWCSEYLGPKALKEPDKKLAVYWAKKRKYGHYYNPQSNNLDHIYCKIYDHENSRWMNKKNSSPNQFWFKDESDAVAFRLMIGEGWDITVKENKNFTDPRKIQSTTQK